MGKDKLRRFRENLTFPHLFQPSYHDTLQGKFPMRGRWREEFFRNSHPITLELGCGRGEYTIALASQNPQRNYIGMDIKGARLWYGGKVAHERQMPNVAFLRGHIETVSHLFAPGEVDEVWITFPDPQLKMRRAKKRLTSPGFLSLYHQFLRPQGVIHLKTDSLELHEYTLGVAQSIGAQVQAAYANIDPHLESQPALRIPTRYEQKFRAEGKPITYLAITLPRQMPPAALAAIPLPESARHPQKAQQ